MLSAAVMIAALRLICYLRKQARINVFTFHMPKTLLTINMLKIGTPKFMTIKVQKMKQFDLGFSYGSRRCKQTGEQCRP